MRFRAFIRRTNRRAVGKKLLVLPKLCFCILNAEFLFDLLIEAMPQFFNSNDSFYNEK